MGQYEYDHTRAWAAKIAELDGFVFVTPLSGALVSPAVPGVESGLTPTRPQQGVEVDVGELGSKAHRA